MCGVIGVVGNNNATEILLSGLKRLEYRGYDSAGIYVNDQHGNDHLIKRVGKIVNLQQAITNEDSGITGIGHTRWATHGKPSQSNAHPHFSQDRRFYLVHNGVINNFAELKAKYLTGVEFQSDTDSEVVVQLVDYFAVTDQVDALTAFRKTLHLLEGSYVLP